MLCESVGGPGTTLCVRQDLGVTPVTIARKQIVETRLFDIEREASTHRWRDATLATSPSVSLRRVPGRPSSQLAVAPVSKPAVRIGDGV